MTPVPPCDPNHPVAYHMLWNTHMIWNNGTLRDTHMLRRTYVLRSMPGCARAARGGCGIPD